MGRNRDDFVNHQYTTTNPANLEAYKLQLLEQIAENTREEPNRFDRFRAWLRENPLRIGLFTLAAVAVYGTPPLVELEWVEALLRGATGAVSTWGLLKEMANVE